MTTMQAGRELDAQIAWQVLGLHQFIRGTKIRTYLCCDACGKTEEAGAHLDILPHYSTNITDAWLIVETLASRWHEKGYRHIHLSSIHEGKSVWYAAFSGPSHPFLSSVTRWEAEADTAPLAICLAALKAVELTGAIHD